MEPSFAEPPNVSATAAFSAAAPAKASGRFFTPKVAGWAMLAGLAASYLAVLAIKPGMIAAYMPSIAPSGSPEDNEGQRANVAAGDVQTLRDSVGQLQLDVAKIKTDLTEKADRDKALETRMAVLEETKRGGTGVAALAPVPGVSATSPGASALAPGAPVAAPANSPVAALTATPAVTAAATAAAKAAAKKAAATAAAAAKAVPAAIAAPAPVTAPIQPTANAAAALAPPLDATAAAPPGVKLINAPLSASSAASRAAPAAAPAPAALAPAAAALAPAAAAPAAILTPPTPGNAAEALAPKFETGSVQNLGATPSPTATGPTATGPTATGPTATGTKPVGIYIGSGPSVDSLRLSWSLLSDRNAEALKPLEPRYTTGIDANGLNYGLVAGPLRSTAEAQKLCKDLAAKAVTCRVGEFTGEAL